MPPSPPPPRKGMSNGVLGGIIAVVVIIILILALGFSGVIPGFKLGGSGSSSTPSGPSYAVTFSETGLPLGTSWSVTFNGATQPGTTSTIVFSEKNGTYSFSVSAAGYTASPASGNLQVSGVSSQSITFTALKPGSYTVTFMESGLPSGTNWSVTLSGAPQSSTGTSILFTEQNGSHPFTVAAVSGYTASPTSGSVTVSGAATTQPITFTKNSGGSPGTATYSQAEPVATGAAGSGWTQVFAVGVSVTAQVSPSEWDQNLTNASCPLSGGSTPPTIPAYTGTYTGGSMEVWEFLFYSTMPELEDIMVYNGGATNLGHISGSSCVTAFGNATISSSVIDSSTAATDFNVNASAFVSAHSSATAAWLLVPVISISYMFGGMTYNYTYGGWWSGTYTTCNGAAGTGVSVTGLVNSTTGAVSSFMTNSSVNCSAGLSPEVHLGGHGLASGESSLLELALKVAREV